VFGHGPGEQAFVIRGVGKREGEAADAGLLMGGNGSDGTGVQATGKEKTYGDIGKQVAADGFLQKLAHTWNSGGKLAR